MSKFAGKKSVPVLFSFVAMLTMSASAITYLKADANEGGNGTSWETAYRNVEEAVKAAETGDNVIYAAGGVYVVSNKMMVADGLTIYGGFSGLSMDDTLDNRDADRNQTILTGDVGMDDYWIHVVPVLGEYRFELTDLPDEPLLVEGKVNRPPAYSGDYDTFRPKFIGNNTLNCFAVGGGVGGIFDGLWFMGFGQTGKTGNCISVDANAKAVKIHDCRFWGNWADYGVVHLMSGLGEISSCEFRYSISRERGAGAVIASSAVVKDCLFEGLNRDIAVGGGAIHLNNGSGAIISRCVFTRSIDHGNSEWGETAFRGAGTILSSDSGNGMMVDCVVSNCLAMSAYSHGIPLMGLKDGTVSHCTFLDNRCEFKPVDGNAYLAFGNVTGIIYLQTYDSCTFRGNVVAAPQIAATEGSYAIGLVGNPGAGSVGQPGDGCKIAVVNCTFDANQVEHVEAEGVSAVLSRGLVCYAPLSSGRAEIGVANCTFRGPGVPDDVVYEIAQFGASQLYPLNVVNSLFLLEDDQAVHPFYVTDPDLFHAYDCSIENLPPSNTGLDINGLYTDHVPVFRENGISFSHVPVFVPAAKIPGLRETADVMTNDFIARCSTHTYRFRLRGETDWRALLPLDTGKIYSSEGTPVSDANGNVRSFGTFTRGAVQPLTPEAEDGATLLLRVEPFGSGRLSRPSTQAVAKGEKIKSVEAIPSEGSSFLGWLNEDGSLFSEALTLERFPLSEDRVLIAKFRPRLVNVTFDLGNAGIFVDGETSVITLGVGAGGPFPEIPRYIPSEDYAVLGWTPAFPAITPDTDAAFHAQTISAHVRVFHVVPEGEEPPNGDGTGSTWENATTNLYAAYEDAGRYRGEIWMKRGTYRIRTPLKSLSNVAILGGFAGTEQTAQEADPVANPTIITGDLNGDNFWCPEDKVPPEGERVPVWSGDIFTEPNPENLDLFWGPQGNSADDANCFISDCGEPATNAGLAGLTITCFGSAAVEMTHKDTDLSISNCRYYANASKCIGEYSGGKSSLVGSNGRLIVEDTDFIGNHRTAGVSPKVVGRRSVFRNCLFRGNSSREVCASLNVGGAGGIIENCRFERNCALSSGIVNAPVRIGMNRYIGDAKSIVTNCVFEGNLGLDGAYATLYNCGRGTLYVNDCAFIRNKITNPTDASPRSAGIASSDWGTLIVADSYFASNRLEVAQSPDGKWWGTVGASTIDPASFFNCTIVDNVASNGSSDAAYIGTFAMLSNCALVNCLIDGSKFYGHCAEFVSGSRGSGTTFTIVNAIMRNVGENYRPFEPRVVLPFNLASCAISRLDVSKFATGDNGCLYDLSSDPGPLSCTRQGPGGRLARGVAASSPYARAGRPVKVTPNGAIYYYDDETSPSSPWRGARYRSTFKAEVPGLPADAPLAADAFGAPRVEGRIAYGPLNVVPGGTMLMIR